MRPARVDPALTGVDFAREAMSAWDEYDHRGDRGALFTFLWANAVVTQVLFVSLQKVVAMLVRRVEALEKKR